MGIFDSQEAKMRKSHFKNMVAIAAADGRLDPNESEILAMIGAKWGLTQAEMTSVLKNPAGIKFSPPKTDEERLHQLYDSVFLMISDGEIDANEKDLCVVIAMKLGLRSSSVDSMIEYIIKSIKAGRNESQVKTELGAFMSG